MVRLHSTSLPFHNDRFRILCSSDHRNGLGCVSKELQQYQRVWNENQDATSWEILSIFMLRRIILVSFFLLLHRTFNSAFFAAIFRSREPKEDMRGFILKKREMFIVGMLIQEKEEEIRKMKRLCEREEAQLRFYHCVLHIVHLLS
jgi:hypothetical protein